MNNTLEVITLEESQRLVALEKTICAGEKQWLDVGLALTEIRDRRLYRAVAATFKDYCKCVWNWSDQRAYQLIAATAENSTSGLGFKTERAARAAIKSRKVTAAAASAPTSPPADDECNPLEIPGVTSGDDDADPWEKPHIEADPIEPKHCEPAVTEYYNRLEALVTDALENATVKQLNSMSVYAKIIPKLIKDAIASRQ